MTRERLLEALDLALEVVLLFGRTDPAVGIFFPVWITSCIGDNLDVISAMVSECTDGPRNPPFALPSTQSLYGDAEMFSCVIRSEHIYCNMDDCTRNRQVSEVKCRAVNCCLLDDNIFLGV